MLQLLQPPQLLLSCPSIEIVKLSRDPQKLEVFAVEYVVDNGNLAFAVTDADKNLILYTHQVTKHSLSLSFLRFFTSVLTV